MSRILITGGTGFLGSALNKILIANGYKIILYSSKKSRRDRILSYQSNIEILYREEISPNELIGNLNIPIIIHHATCFGRLGESDSEIFQTNLHYSIELFEAGIKCGMKWFFNSDTTLPGELNTYSLSKCKFREYLYNRVNILDVKVINLKLESIYGPGDDNSKFLTWFMNQCKKNIDEIDLTSGEQKRDYIYIDDAALAYYLIIHKRDKIINKFENIDIGTGQAISLNEICQLIKKITSSTTKLNFGKIPYRNYEKMVSVANINRLKDFGFEIETKLKYGLKKMMEIDT